MFERILVGTDGSESATRAVAKAVELARRDGAELIVVHAHPDPNVGYALASDVSPTLERVKAIMNEIETKLAADINVRTVVRQGDAASVLLDVAEEEKAGLIVVGNKGMTGTRRFLVGSVPNRVSHHAECDVLVVHTT
jgi:nucleotide-binding universal stress UspA family protein